MVFIHLFLMSSISMAHLNCKEAISKVLSAKPVHWMAIGALVAGASRLGVEQYVSNLREQQTNLSRGNRLRVAFERPKPALKREIQDLQQLMQMKLGEFSNLIVVNNEYLIRPGSDEEAKVFETLKSIRQTLSAMPTSHSQSSIRNFWILESPQAIANMKLTGEYSEIIKLGVLPIWQGISEEDLRLKLR